MKHRLDVAVVRKTVCSALKLEEAEALELRQDTALFSDACTYTHTHLEATFPDAKQLDMFESTLKKECLMIIPATSSVEEVQSVLSNLLSNSDHVLLEWRVFTVDNTHATLLMQKNWACLKLYWEELQDIDACVKRLAQALCNTDMDETKQSVLVRLLSERTAHKETESAFLASLFTQCTPRRKRNWLSIQQK
jgi:hypothetical protein